METHVNPCSKLFLAENWVKWKEWNGIHCDSNSYFESNKSFIVSLCV